MAYSINPMLRDYADQNGLQKVYIQVIYNRVTIKAGTIYKIKKDQFLNGSVVNHPNKTAINRNIRAQIIEIEGRIMDFKGTPTKAELYQLANDEAPRKQQLKFVDFIKKYCSEITGKRADATVTVYESLIPDLIEYDENLTIDKINISWLNLYEQWQRSKGWDINTIHKKMSKIKTLLSRAADIDLIDEKKFRKYVVPVYIQKIPEYISEIEMQAIKDLVDKIGNPVYKTAGYYFLLGCYAGYRISDLKKFNHVESLKDDKIILRAKKNKNIVLMPLHSRLAQIINYVKDHPIDLSEQKMREYVKEIVKMAGIKRHIKIHTARHSFAMMLMDNGFDLEEVAALLGVSLKTAAIYGHISNKRLESKVKSKLG